MAKQILYSHKPDDGKEYKFIVRKGERGYAELSTEDIQQRMADQVENDKRAPAAAINGAKHYMEKRLIDSVVTVNVDGTDHQFGMDKLTRDQVMTRVTAQAAGITTSEEWTPRGMRHPITMTTEDMKKVAQAMMDREEAIIAVYLGHKGNLMGMTTALDVKRYDFKKGYPA